MTEAFLAALTKEELTYLSKELKREPNRLEKEIIAAEWSEHCSYKSSKKYIKKLPNEGKHVLIGPGYDAGVLGVGDGYVVTVHIESHNHPSAVDPYGGSSTGVGGVIRDIISMGTRPIALLDSLRFAPISKHESANSDSGWLLKNVVKGIGDYGNCIGVPTVGGEVEFDASFADYCLVDVVSIGIGSGKSTVRNTASWGDIIILVGGATGRDGINGAAFASKKYERKERSAVQIADPFTEKLLIEAILEGIESDIIKALKDLGGGGLSCCLSEMSDNLGLGFNIELDQIHIKESGMSPIELMISESQERMVVVVDPTDAKEIGQIFRKYGLRFTTIGKVENHGNLIIKNKKRIVAQLPSHLVANAPLAYRAYKKPAYLLDLNRRQPPVFSPLDLSDTLFLMLSNPTIASKKWIYSQYDFEVGLRTKLQPGIADASVLRLDNGKHLAIKLDGNSKHCYIDPYNGTLGCLSEACRNITCTGATPIGVVDHLQFGNPENPDIFWSFRQAVKAVTDFCKFAKVPVVGGKVSFYNETNRGPIKPTPVIGAIGLIQRGRPVLEARLKEGDTLFVIGNTLEELGGSEYYEFVHNFTGGKVPRVDLKNDQTNRNTVLYLVNNAKVSCMHDCSKGGIATAISEMAILGAVGFELDVDRIPNSCLSLEGILFSESHSRFLIGTQRPDDVENILSSVDGLIFSRIGKASNAKVSFRNEGKCIIDTNIHELTFHHNAIERIMIK